MRFLFVRLQRLDLHRIGKLLRRGRGCLFLFQLRYAGIEIGNGVLQAFNLQLRLFNGELHFFHIIDEQDVSFFDLLPDLGFQLLNLAVFIALDLDLILCNHDARTGIELTGHTVAGDHGDRLYIDGGLCRAAAGQQAEQQYGNQKQRHPLFFHNSSSVLNFRNRSLDVSFSRLFPDSEEIPKKGGENGRRAFPLP